MSFSLFLLFFFFSRQGGHHVPEADGQRALQSRSSDVGALSPLSPAPRREKEERSAPPAEEEEKRRREEKSITVLYDLPEHTNHQHKHTHKIKHP